MPSISITFCRSYARFELQTLTNMQFPHFSPTCFDILSSNFAYDFVLMYHRSSVSVVTLLKFLLELCLFVNLEYSKYTVFRTFLLHALTYWAEIVHMIFLMYYRSSSSVVNLRRFLWELCPWNLEYCKYTVFRTFLLHPLTSWAEILHFFFLYYRSSLTVVNLRLFW